MITHKIRKHCALITCGNKFSHHKSMRVTYTSVGLAHATDIDIMCWWRCFGTR